MPQLGLGLGLHKGSLGLTPLSLLKKYTSAMWLPSKASGYNFPSLAPRTLPNGVSNSEHVQNVSNDVVLNGSENWNESGWPQSNFITFELVIPQIKQNVDNAVKSDLFETVSDSNFTTAEYECCANNIYSTFWVRVSKSKLTTQNVSGFKAWLATNPLTIRYQLATPIDTLNSPFTNPLIDLNGFAPLTLNNFAGTSASGYVDEPLWKDNGSQEVNLVNLLGNDGNMNDSNVDNRADGWNYNLATPISCLNNEAIISMDSIYASIEHPIAVSIGDVVYGFCEVRPNIANVSWLHLGEGDGTNTSATLIDSVNIYKFYSGSINIMTTNFQGIRVMMNQSTTTTFKIRNFGGFNMTTIFPNPATRPTKLQMDRLVQECIAKYGYVNTRTLRLEWVTFLKFDGIDDYANGDNPSLEILGTSDFGFGKFATVPTATTRYLLSKAEQSEATTQYALKITNTGVLSIILEGTTVQLATGLLINTMYSIWVERISGVLKCFINGVEVFSVANTTALTTRPNFRVGAMSTNVGGTTHTGFSNANVGALVISKTDVLKARQAWFNFTLKTFGL